MQTDSFSEMLTDKIAVFIGSRLQRRAELLEADADLAREKVRVKEEEDDDVKWLDTIARAEAQIQKYYHEMLELGAAARSGENGPPITVLTNIPRPGEDGEAGDEPRAD